MLYEIIEKMHVHSLANFWCRQYPQMETITTVFPKDINPPGFTNSLSLCLFNKELCPCFGKLPVFMYTNYQKTHSDSFFLFSS